MQNVVKRVQRQSQGGQSNFNNFGLGNINMEAQIQKLQGLLAKVQSTSLTHTTPAFTTPTMDDDGVAVYTRQQLDDLYKKNAKRGWNSDSDNGNAGYFDKLFFMFQLYIAFIHALMNTANMGASFIFGNQTLQNLFSVFLESVLSMILKTNVGDLTPEQLRDLLEKNRPVIQQVSAILIDEASNLLLGLSDVCSKIAMDWIKNILPGLVKSAAIGIPSALEAAIPPLGEVVEIVNTGLALMASFMKIVGGLQRNYDNVSQGYGHVKDAYGALQKVKDLLSQSPEDMLKSATAAVVTPVVTAAANTALNRVLSPNPYLNASPDANASAVESNNSPRAKIANPLGTLAGKVRNNYELAKYGAKRLGTTVTGLAGSMGTRLADEMENVAGQPELRSVQGIKSVGKNIVRPVASGLNNLSRRLDEMSGGSSRKMKMKSRKYSKNPQQFNKYISNLRRKTAKKEMQLLNSIRELKSI
jgi:hypothetical protein